MTDAVRKQVRANRRAARSAQKKKSKAWAKKEFGSASTPCASACIRALGIENFNVCCTVRDVLRIARRNGWSCRSRNAKMKIRKKGKARGKTVNQLKAEIILMNDEFAGWIVHVEGHVLLIGSDGTIHTDTDPRDGTDRRKVLNLFRISRKS